MTGRPRTVDDDEIFAAVATVVSERGPNGLTLGAIAGEAGITAPALTQRFGSKRGLLVAFADHASRDVERVFERARRRRSGPLDALTAALIDLTRPIRTRAELANNLALLHLDLTDDELGRFAADQSRQIRAGLAALVDEAMATGEIEPGDSAALADLLYTVFNGALITWAIDGTGSLRTWLTQRVERVLAPHRR